MKGFEAYLVLFIIALFIVCIAYIAYLIKKHIAVLHQILLELRAHEYKITRINEHLYNIDNDMYFIKDYCIRKGGSHNERNTI